MFYWANQDQYYVKSGNSFLDYRFKIGEHEYCFKLKEDESAIEISNNKIAVERYYIFEDEVGSENNKTQIWFSYRGLTEFEKNKVEETIGKTLNQTNTNKLSIERMKNNPKINQNQQLWKNVIIRDGKLDNKRDGKQSGSSGI